MTKLERLAEALQRLLGQRVRAVSVDRGEVRLDVDSANYLEVAQSLRDEPELAFEQLMDLCGIDYSGYSGTDAPFGRFAAVSQLLSLKHNFRIRLRTFAADDSFPVVASLNDIWPSVNWYEREAFDLFGIMFEGHPDLRRILTDYGFVGHPFRKDFPVSGFSEMRYDAEEGRVIYQAVTIEPRENTPRIVREDKFGGLNG